MAAQAPDHFGAHIAGCDLEYPDVALAGGDVIGDESPFCD
jgi:hypothetical protein